MIRTSPSVDLALMLATSGHSGVDRLVQHLLTVWADSGLTIDQLCLRNHGPHIADPPPNLRRVDLKAAHVATALPALVVYLHRHRPRALLTDKHKINRIALWGRRLAGVPTRVVIRTGTTVSRDLIQRGGLRRWTQPWSMRRLYPDADGIVVPSRGAAEDLATVAGLPLERITVIPNPVPVPPWEALLADPPPHPWLGEDRPVILGAGELSGRKDFATLVRAFARVRSNRPCRLIIIGRGRERDHLESLARELKVADDLALPGFVTDPLRWMVRAAVVALTSRHEGFANVLAEALTLGVPVVSTDCPSGPREILDGGRYGPLVPVGDEGALATALERVLEQPVSREQLLIGAERYRPDIIAHRYLEVLGLERKTCAA